jgi:hypothetical protein
MEFSRNGSLGPILVPAASARRRNVNDANDRYSNPEAAYPLRRIEEF